MTNILLFSWDEKLTGDYDPEENIIVFRGGKHGQHSLHVEGGVSAERIISHFDGYCSNNKTHPNYRGWRRDVVVERLAACIRAIKESQDVVRRTRR